METEKLLILTHFVIFLSLLCLFKCNFLSQTLFLVSLLFSLWFFVPKSLFHWLSCLVFLRFSSPTHSFWLEYTNSEILHHFPQIYIFSLCCWLSLHPVFHPFLITLPLPLLPHSACDWKHNYSSIKGVKAILFCIQSDILPVKKKVEQRERWHRMFPNETSHF